MLLSARSSRKRQRCASRQMNTSAKRFLTKLGLSDYDQKISLLSGGQKRRVAMACALAAEAEVLILDEPIGGVKGTYAMVGVLEKGYGDLKFIARGKGGHASAPGRNTPLVRLGRFMAAVEKKSPFTSKFSPAVLEMFRRLTRTWPSA